MFLSAGIWFKTRIRSLLGRVNTYIPKKFSRLPKKIIEFDTIEGFLSQREATALYYYSSKVKLGGTIVEIGSWKGKSTFCLARGLRSGKVAAIDPFDASGDPAAAQTYKRQKGENDLLIQFKENMSRLGVTSKIEILKGYSSNFKDKFKSIDLLFIDGDHSIEGCKSDFDLFAHLIVSGGYIMFHDYDPMRDGLGSTWVIKNLIENNTAFKNVDIIDSLWIGRRQ